MQFALYALPVVFLIFLALEQAFPLRKAKWPLGRRLVVNACIAALALTAAATLVRPVVSTLLDHSAKLGVLSIGAVPEGAQAVIGFLWFDLSFYYWHRANHAFGFLWRFHNAHHIDPDLDVSTAFRFHFVEIGLSAGFRAVQIVLIGGPPWIVAAYELAFQLNNLFQHSNVRIPIAVERWLSLVLMTPRMHGIHHSQVRIENNSNLSSVCSLWDRLHGTLCLNVPQAQLNIGIAGYSLAEDNQVKNVLVMPFRGQRDYWRSPRGADASRSSGFDHGRQSQLAE